MSAARAAELPAAELPPDLAWLRTPSAIRQRAQLVMAHAEAGRSAWFAVDPDGLERAVQATLAVTRERFPDPAAIPFHARWRHFEAGGVDRWAALAPRLQALPADEIARRRIDLAIISVLLDAGAGPSWRYVEPGTGKSYSRSEGLGVASLHMFAAGLFSRDPTGDPLRADAERLVVLSAAEIAAGFQVTADNPMVGLDGRAGLLRRLGGVGLARPGELFDVIVRGDQLRTNGMQPGEMRPDVMPMSGIQAEEPQQRAEVAAPAIMAAVLDRLSPVWPLPAGDVWRHPVAGWVPFHKLSQWLSYSLVEPLQGAGLTVTELDALTGLPEYRNGGLLIDAGALRAKQPALLEQTFTVGDEPIVEWRALTVVLLDRIAVLVRQHLGLDAAALPLVKILEGGTWFAGRRLAAERRPGGGPPIAIHSDGTVF